jgi:hypothetical protein
MTLPLQTDDRAPRRDSEVELSIVMPCLNEAETLASCIQKAHRFLKSSGVGGEIVVADNGSSDASPTIALKEGARLVQVNTRGYGAALLAGITSARGRYVVMGDADDSYDFLRLAPFLEKLHQGADLVVGNRFRGGIARGAMPFLHRYLGNPFLSFIGRLFFGVNVWDFYCGLRGFVRERILALGLKSTGMEFAIEMIVRSSLAGYTVVEVATPLQKDGRSRPSHLRTWSDGWRTLRFLFLFSPTWLFIYPGLLLLCFGAVGATVLLPGPIYIGSVGIDFHSFTVACFAILVGLQSICFGIVARRYGLRTGFIPERRHSSRVWGLWTLERVLVIAGIIFALGLGGFLWCVSSWISTGFGPISYNSFLRILVLSLTALAGSIQLAFTAFLAEIMEIPTRN